MQFKQGAAVKTAEGHDVGHIDRVVIDPRSQTVTHIVVRKGTLFTEDKVVPIGLIAGGNNDIVRLIPDVGDLHNLPDYEETHFIEPGEEIDSKTAEIGHAMPLYWYPPEGAIMGGYGDIAALSEPTVTERHIPAGSIALREGAPVHSSDNHHVGSVVRVLTGDSNKVSHILVSNGVLLKEVKLVPTDWIAKIEDEQVRLAITAKLFHKIEQYKEV
jgi:uncharacterized protein YrrD